MLNKQQLRELRDQAEAKLGYLTHDESITWPILDVVNTYWLSIIEARDKEIASKLEEITVEEGDWTKYYELLESLNQ